MRALIGRPLVRMPRRGNGERAICAISPPQPLARGDAGPARAVQDELRRARARRCRRGHRLPGDARLRTGDDLDHRAVDDERTGVHRRFEQQAIEGAAQDVNPGVRARGAPDVSGPSRRAAGVGMETAAGHDGVETGATKHLVGAWRN